MFHSRGHLAILPNVHVPQTGALEVELFVADASLQGEHRLLDADGAAMVLHAKPDDYRSDPAGAASERIACGVIAGPVRRSELRAVAGAPGDRPTPSDSCQGRGSGRSMAVRVANR